MHVSGDLTLLIPTAEFSIWTREAGAGGLSIAVEGPSKAEISFEDRKDGSCGVSYIVQEAGECIHFSTKFSKFKVLGLYKHLLTTLWEKCLFKPCKMCNYFLAMVVFSTENSIRNKGTCNN